MTTLVRGWGGRIRISASYANSPRIRTINMALAAKRVLDDEKLPNIAFHLAILALERTRRLSIPAKRRGDAPFRALFDTW
jgi:hypothetical protein